MIDKQIQIDDIDNDRYIDDRQINRYRQTIDREMMADRQMIARRQMRDI